MKKAVLIVGLTLSGCGAGPAATPPEEPTHNPPAPTLPRWEDVPSGHPEGATNPPSPSLIMDAQGRCYKLWEGGMMRTDGDRVITTCDAGQCGTEISCPPDAAERVKPKTAPDAEPPG